uniref:Uncharacterized protein n=1 Tax=Oryza punctata TaxID=4537 RepID=A0A0E0MN86_ORYPU
SSLGRAYASPRATLSSSSLLHAQHLLQPRTPPLPTTTSSLAAAAAYFFPNRRGQSRGRPLPPPPRTPPLPTPTSSPAAAGAGAEVVPFSRRRHRHRTLHRCPATAGVHRYRAPVVTTNAILLPSITDLSSPPAPPIAEEEDGVLPVERHWIRRGR